MLDFQDVSELSTSVLPTSQSLRVGWSSHRGAVEGANGLESDALSSSNRFRRCIGNPRILLQLDSSRRNRWDRWDFETSFIEWMGERNDHHSGLDIVL